MRKRALSICCTVCVLGAFGTFCRWLQNMTAFEADTGLYLTGNIWGQAMTVLMLAAVVILFLSISHMKRLGLAAGRTFEHALGNNTAFHKPVGIFIAVLMVVGSMALVFTADDGFYPLLLRILALLGILSALGFLIMASCARTPTDPAIACFGSALPIFLGCFWLIISYREDASTPVIWSYAPEILALACSLMAFYYIAGFAFGRPRPYAAIFFSGLGACFCIATLPDERLMALQIMFIAMAAMQLYLLWGTVANLRTREQLEELYAVDEPETDEAGNDTSDDGFNY